MALGTTKITMTAIRDALGESTLKLSELCMSALINKWSRNKPVRGTFPSASDGKFGLQLPLWSNTTKTFTPTNWNYLTILNNARMGDFRGYEHDSALTFPPIYCKDSDQEKHAVLSPAQPSGGFSSCTAKAKMLTGASDVRLNIGNLSLSDFYFGVLIKTPADTWFIRTNAAKLSTGDETNGLSFVYWAALDDPTNPASTYQNLPYGVGQFTAYYVITSTDYSTGWTQNPTGVIYLLPSGTVTGLTFENSYTFTVSDWVYAATGSMGFLYSDDDYSEYKESIIYMSDGAEPFTVSMDDATWAEFKVYAPDGTNDITKIPSAWTNGSRLRVFPINANGGAAKTGTVYVNGANTVPYPIFITHQAAPATVNVYAGDVDVLTVSATGGNVSGARLNIEFTPHYVPDNVPKYDVCWYIKVNDVDMYSSGSTGIASQQDIHENLQSIAYGNTVWKDGDVIDVYLYYEQAPPIA
ncbi:MAG: hypothetical protein BWY95_02172 [Bacteroidetes bacterium ADurb.BinA104]|nr:MAG: hypothetical protein BWY95_02172 [Bacteroidetes bacterium ADurb.BinA104]